jgi:DNA-directed RNA polymerase specialized sigma24 family protein
VGARRTKRRNNEPPVEQEIARLLSARDPRAIELAYDRWGEESYAFALALVGSPPSAEAIVEAAYLALWRQPAGVLTAAVELESFIFEAVIHGARSIHYGPRGLSQIVTEPDSPTATAQPSNGPSAEFRARALRHSFFNPVWRERG